MPAVRAGFRDQVDVAPHSGTIFGSDNAFYNLNFANSLDAHHVNLVELQVLGQAGGTGIAARIRAVCRDANAAATKSVQPNASTASSGLAGFSRKARADFKDAGDIAVRKRNVLNF